MKEFRKILAVLLVSSLIAVSALPAMAEEGTEAIEIVCGLEISAECPEQKIETPDSAAAEDSSVIPNRENNPETVEVPEGAVEEIALPEAEIEPVAEALGDHENDEIEATEEPQIGEPVLPPEETEEITENAEPAEEITENAEPADETEEIAESTEPAEKAESVNRGAEPSVEEKLVNRDEEFYVKTHEETIDGVVRTIIEVISPLGNTQSALREAASGDYTAGEQVVKITAGALLDLVGSILPPGVTAIVSGKLQETIDKLCRDGAIEDPFEQMGHPWQEQATKEIVNKAAEKVEEFTHTVATYADIALHVFEIIPGLLSALLS